MEMLRMVGIRAGPQDRFEGAACRHPHPGKKVGFLGIGRRRDADDPTAGQLEAADVDGVGEGVLREFRRAIARTADKGGAVTYGDKVFAEYRLGGGDDDLCQEAGGCLGRGAIEYGLRRDIDALAKGRDGKRVADDTAGRFVDRGTVGEIDAKRAQSRTARKLICRDRRCGSACLVRLVVARRRIGGRGLLLRFGA